MIKNRTAYLIMTSLITIILLYVFDQVFTLSYLSKIGLKLILFSVFPLYYILKTGDNIIQSSLKNFTLKSKGKGQLNLGLLLGILVFMVILVAYIILKDAIDADQLITEFDHKYKINKGNIMGYSFYLVFINSFLEEFFFRGYMFLNLKALGKRKLAYGFSSFCFAVYHIANFQNWFHIGVFLLALIALFVGGCLFNYLDDQVNSFLNSWFVHICADAAIVLIGFYLFGLFA